MNDIDNLAALGQRYYLDLAAAFIRSRMPGAPDLSMPQAGCIELNDWPNVDPQGAYDDQNQVTFVVSGDRKEEPWQRVFDLRVESDPEPLRELRRVHRIAATYRRRRNFDERTSLEEEVERAREAGLPPDAADFECTV